MYFVESVVLTDGEHAASASRKRNILGGPFRGYAQPRRDEPCSPAIRDPFRGYAPPQPSPLGKVAPQATDEVKETFARGHLITRDAGASPKGKPFLHLPNTRLSF